MTESFSNIKSNSLVRGIIYEKEGFTKEEIYQFNKDLVEYINDVVVYCTYDKTPSLKTGEQKTTKERLEMLAFAILSAIDGESSNIGGYILIPYIDEHIYDPNYILPDHLSNYDTAGQLHHIFTTYQK